MPKIPKSGTPSDGKKPADKPPRRAKAARGDGAKRPAASKTKRRKSGATATAVADQMVQRPQVDEAPARGPAGPKAQLSEDQRVLLGDLFAVIEEHAADAVEQVDREKVQGAFVFACERHVD